MAQTLLISVPQVNALMATPYLTVLLDRARCPPSVPHHPHDKLGTTPSPVTHAAVSSRRFLPSGVDIPITPIAHSGIVHDPVEDRVGHRWFTQDNRPHFGRRTSRLNVAETLCDEFVEPPSVESGKVYTFDLLTREQSISCPSTMVEKNPSVTLAKPEPFWNKPLRADWKNFFKSIGKALVIRQLKQDLSEAAGEISDALTAVGLETGASEVAWNLFRHALAGAVAELIRASVNDRRLPVLEEETELVFDDRIIESLENSEVQLDTSLLQHPERLPLLDEIASVFRAWLFVRGMDRAEAGNVAQRLRSYFVFHLHKEWGRKPAEYAKLCEVIQTPFTMANERERAWMRYWAFLGKLVNEPMFDETFGLVHVYVPLRAYYEEELQTGSDRRVVREAADHVQRVRRRVVNIDEELEAWIERGDKDDELRIICGGPGSGKSSCARMFAARMAQKMRRVLFIPLHLINPTHAIPLIVGQFVADGNLMPSNPLEGQGDKERLILIFDGLDELSMQGKSGAERARSFLHEVVRFASLRNASGTRVQVLVGGREIVVQEMKDNLIRASRQVLTLLPYLVSPEQQQQEAERGIEYILSGALLDDDQRTQWWSQYAAIKGHSYDGMPEELNLPDLVEITAQPLLNYLIALSRERGTINLKQGVLRNQIYQDLFERVHERAHANNVPHPATTELRNTDFVALLEEIGASVWHGNGRTATVKEIQARCGTRLDALLKRYEHGDARVMSLLTAFYFRKEGQRDDLATFEFTHKSFGEYFTARRIVRALDEIHAECSNNQRWGRGELKKALCGWAALCGPTAIDADLLRFVVDEVAFVDRSLCEQWQVFLQNLIELVLRHGMPMEQLAARLSHINEVHQARNAEEALLALVFACSQRTKKVTRIQWPDTTSAKKWIYRLQGQTTSKGRVLVTSCLGRLDLSNCDLSSMDLFGGNLGLSDLHGANLQNTSLHLATLGSAILADANLRRANLDTANLFNADLRGADLTDCKLDGAKLSQAKLDGAKMPEGWESVARLDPSYRWPPHDRAMHP